MLIGIPMQALVPPPPPVFSAPAPAPAFVPPVPVVAPAADPPFPIQLPADIQFRTPTPWEALRFGLPAWDACVPLVWVGEGRMVVPIGYRERTAEEVVWCGQGWVPVFGVVGV
jgi:hypothetical protein